MPEVFTETGLRFMKRKSQSYWDTSPELVDGKDHDFLQKFYHIPSDFRGDIQKSYRNTTKGKTHKNLFNNLFILGNP